MKALRPAIGVDTGGTFTDFLFMDKGQWTAYKCLSTPSDPANAVLQGLRSIDKGGARYIVHGSTVATNTILERKGARTALITNTGMEDIIEIGRQNRSRLYDLAYQREAPIVPPHLRFKARGRILSSGVELEPIDPESAKSLCRRLKEFRVESIAVCLLFSFLNPTHEKRIGKWLQNTGIPFSLSHEILAEFREYERMSTTVINAYVLPKMAGYLKNLRKKLGPRDQLRIMQSNGGSISAGIAMKESVRTILSGPAGGVVGAYETAKAAGYSKVITFDMGGTSTDVSLLNGALPFSTASAIAGFPVKVPMLDIHTVGAGGGSIAFLDSGGALKVGPESAGADPGPICYGRGKEMTVTDANLYLGRLLPEHFLGGRMRLYQERLWDAIQELATETHLSPVELSEGILAVANVNMEKALRVISIEKGFDPREFILFAFGGAGGMHAAFLAQQLGIPKVLVPVNPGILSAMGMLLSDVVKDYSLTIMVDEEKVDNETLGRHFSDLEVRAFHEFQDEKVDKEDLHYKRYLDMRYRGQSFELIVPFDENYGNRFHRLHEKTYGYRNVNQTVEIVNIRVRAIGRLEKPTFKKKPFVSKRPSPEAIVGKGRVVFKHRSRETAIYNREMLKSGNRIEGPAIVVEYSSTTVIPPFAMAVVDSFGNLIMDIA